MSEEPFDDATPSRRFRPPTRRAFLGWAGALGAVAGADLTLPQAALAAPDRSSPPACSVGSSVFDPIRPPATPLAVRSPYLNTWMAADSIVGVWPTFWTGRVTAMTGIARIDGTAY